MMTSRFKNSARFGWMTLVLAGAIFIDGCSCQDGEEPIWLFEEPEEFDAELPQDTPPVEEDVAIDEEDWDWAFPDPEIEPDAPDWEETDWIVEVIDQGIPRSFADDDRTSVIVDRQGTVWLGYHRCETPQCSNPQLVVGHRRVGSDEWIWERIEGHTGLFGLQIIEADHPIVIYLDAEQSQLKAATREGEGRWVIEVLPVDQVGPFDGFDISRDRARYYVSHASRSRGNIEFLTYNTASIAPYWRRLPGLESARSAAYERGLKAGNALNFYLVHRDRFDSYLLSEYDLGSNEWTRSSDTFPAAISSLLVRQNGEICTAGPSPSDLLVTCGTFDDPLRRRESIHGSPVYYLSSMIEARDESLFVAYHDGSDQSLWVARKIDGEAWSTEFVREGQTFGASTAIDHRDHLLMTYYLCDASSCAIHLLERAPH